MPSFPWLCEPNIRSHSCRVAPIYHDLVLEQARRSFRWALVSAIFGFLFFIAAVIFLLLQQPQNIATVSLISGALVEVISTINFYLYGKASTQLSDFQIRLDVTQRFLLANSVCEGLEGETKLNSRADLVRAIAGCTLSVHPNGTNSEQKTK